MLGRLSKVLSRTKLVDEGKSIDIVYCYVMQQDHIFVGSLAFKKSMSLKPGGRNATSLFLYGRVVRAPSRCVVDRIALSVLCSIARI